MTDSIMQAIVGRLRHADIEALITLRTHLCESCSHSPITRDNFILYASYEFLPTNINELDIILAKLIHQAIFENKETNHYFLDDKHRQIREGADLYLRATIFTHHLKEEKIDATQLTNQQGQVDLDGRIKEAYQDQTWRFFAGKLLPDLIKSEKFNPQRKLVEKGISEFIKHDHKLS